MHCEGGAEEMVTAAWHCIWLMLSSGESGEKSLLLCH